MVYVVVLFLLFSTKNKTNVGKRPIVKSLYLQAKGIMMCDHIKRKDLLSLYYFWF